MFKALLFVMVLLFVSACSSCNNSEPSVLLFPNSNLVSKTVSLDTSEQSIFTYIYEANTTWGKLLDYYSAEINCHTAPLNQDRIVCNGSAKPDGIYYVYIDKKSQELGQNLSYTVEISWQKPCTVAISLH
jgi:hypothetical protein